MKFIPSLALGLFIAASVHAAEIDRAAAALAGSEASFTQRFTPKGFTKTQSESGTVVFGNLPQMRWSYSRPEEKLFVFDGSRSWFYVPADKQVTVTTLDDSRKSELPFLLLGDPAARERNFVVSETAKGGSVVATLKPKSGSAMIRNVVVTINPSTHAITSVAYADREGNQTVFDFSGFRKRSTSGEMFRFVAPAGVQVV